MADRVSFFPERDKRFCLQNRPRKVDGDSLFDYELVNLSQLDF
jgi:hypothetical protein